MTASATGDAQETDDILVLQELVKHFPVRRRRRRLGRGEAVSVHAVDGVSLRVRRGSSFGLVGESGSGKTTVSRLILRLEEPSAGSVLFSGVDLSASQLTADQLHWYRRRVQAVFQDASSSLSPRMRIRDLVAEPVRLLGSPPERSRRALQERVAELLPRVGLSADMLHQYPHELSGGQKQRVAIARSLSVSPELIVLDEPVSALDVSVRGQVLNLLAELQQSDGLTYFIVAHDLALLRHITDQIAVMYLGEIIEMGDTDKVLQAPVHPYTIGLRNAVPSTRPGSGRDRPAVRGEIASPTDPPAGCRFHPRCPFAEKICTERAPALKPSSDGQLVACHVFNP